MVLVRYLTSFTLFIALLLFPLSPVAASDIRFIDVASVNWTGSKAFTATVSQVESSIRDEVGPRWKRYTSFEGASQDRSITFTHGQSLSSPITLNTPMACEGRSASEFMNFIRAESYKRMGITDYSKRYLVILIPDAGCIWSGRALIGDIKVGGGVMTLQDSASAYIIIHELGHALGLGHSNLMRCDSGKSDGPWGSDCKALEYGGAIDVMGNVDVDSTLSTYNQWIAGYLENSEIKQSWLSEKIELSASDIAGSTRVIFLRDGKATYWIEYRRASFATNYKAGLVIFRTDPPPTSAIVSPNPEDSQAGEFGPGISRDYWMLNWDNYTYIRSKAAGSMTLPQGSVATTFSGNISISAAATDSDRKVTVSITRKADTTPPAAPEIIDPSQWRYPEVSIIKSGYDDGETAIAGFEADINGKVSAVTATAVANYSPTYLNPFSPEKTVYLKNLPEGDYNIALRSIDVWGNKSPWSKPVKAYVDRGSPVITSDLKVSSIDPKQTTFSWSGLRDEGIGLCSTILHNQEGFVLSRSKAKSSPTFSLPTGSSLSASAQVFDCLGNGMAGDISLSSSFIETSKSRRTGKWSPAPIIYGAGALKCSGKCSASMSVSGSISALIGEGSAEILVAGKTAAKVANSTAQILRISDSVTLGARNKVIRVSGRNFVFGGLAKFAVKVGEFKEIAKGPEFPDPSLDEPVQKAMSRFGFNQEDFTGDWTVLPMARGTTLLDPTLDLCSASYPSEIGREIRRQISVTKVGSPYLFLSSESVKYRSASAAGAALAELKKNYETCVANKGGSENGTFTEYSFQALPKSNATLVDEKSRVVVRATIGTGLSARQLLGIYQYSGMYFTGLYIVTAGEKPIPDEEILRWMQAGALMAERLQASATIQG